MAALFALSGLAVLVWRRQPLAGTTLMAPWWWTALAFAGLAAGELLIQFCVGGSACPVEIIRYAAATITLCPAMAVLGAKRPQDRGWQFVVVTLLILLGLPWIEALLFRPGEPLHLAMAFRGLLLVMMMLGLINYLPTRFWASSLLIFAGQWALLSAYLPMPPFWLESWRAPVGVGALLAAVLLAVTAVRSQRRQPTPLDQAWADFRNSFGLLWGLRVLEQFRAANALCKWRLHPRWGQLVGDRPELSAEDSAAAARCLQNQWRRFVSPKWIAERLDRP